MAARPSFSVLTSAAGLLPVRLVVLTVNGTWLPLAAQAMSKVEVPLSVTVTTPAPSSVFSADWRLASRVASVVE